VYFFALLTAKRLGRNTCARPKKLETNPGLSPRAETSFSFTVSNFHREIGSSIGYMLQYFLKEYFEPPLVSFASGLTLASFGSNCCIVGDIFAFPAASWEPTASAWSRPSLETWERGIVKALSRL
jgi:hypothetical protein